jgi:hypothetical protein
MKDLIKKRILFILGIFLANEYSMDKMCMLMLPAKKMCSIP